MPHNKRPAITTTEQHLKTFVPFVPGKKTYSDAIGGCDILIVGSSMIHRIRKKEFSGCLEGSQARFKVFPGATIDKINYYLIPELRENNFKKVVVHSGTNDLYNKSAAHEKHEYPPSLSEYGHLRLPSLRSHFLQCLKSLSDEQLEIYNSPQVDAIIIDGAPWIHMHPPRTSTRFGDYCKNEVVTPILNVTMSSALTWFSECTAQTL